MGDQAEKMIAGHLQAILSNLMEIRELTSSVNTTLDRVAYRDDKKDPPEEKNLRKDPQNITEFLSILRSVSEDARIDLNELQIRANRLF